MAAHSSMLAWKIPWTAEPGSYLPRSCKESDTTEQLHFHFHFSRKQNTKMAVNFLQLISVGKNPKVTLNFEVMLPQFNTQMTM